MKIFVRLLIPALVWASMALGLHAQVYGPTRFYGDVSIGTWAAASNLTVSVAASAASQHSTAWAFTYRIGGTNFGGRLPMSTNVSASGDGVVSNAITLTWPAQRGISKIVVERSDDAGTNWSHVALHPATTNWTDIGTNSWTSGSITGLYAIIRDASYPWQPKATNSPTSGYVLQATGTGLTEVAWLPAAGGGDMLTSVYDQDVDGKVDADAVDPSVTNAAVTEAVRVSTSLVAQVGYLTSYTEAEPAFTNWGQTNTYIASAVLQATNSVRGALAGWAVEIGLATNAGAAGAGYYAMSNGVWTAFAPGEGGGGAETDPVWADWKSQRAVSLGSGATTNTDGDVAIGYDVVASNYSVVIGTDSYAIGGADDVFGSVAIGYLATASYEGVAIGHGVSALVGGVAVGHDTTADGVDAVALGWGAVASGSGSVQIGEGTNAAQNTLSIYGWQLLDANGMVPSERVPYAVPTNTTITINGQVAALDTNLSFTVVGGDGISAETATNIAQAVFSEQIVGVTTGDLAAIDWGSLGGGGTVDTNAILSVSQREPYLITSAPTVTVLAAWGNLLRLDAAHASVTLTAEAGVIATNYSYSATLELNRGTNTIVWDTEVFTNTTLLDISTTRTTTLNLYKPQRDVKAGVRQ